jgi:hypothetical protein
MKKLGLIGAVLLLVATPVWAVHSRVDITCTADGNVVTVNYKVNPTADEPNKVRALALDIMVDNPAKINDVNNYPVYNVNDPTSYQQKYWVYPGSIVITNGIVTDSNTPVASATRFPVGTLPGLDSNGVTVEMGSLYSPTGDNSPNAPGTSGTLLKFKVCHVFNGCKVKIRENVIRGGVVLTNPTADPDVNSPDYTFNLECFSSGYTTYNDWKTLGKPNCWCGIKGTPQWPYQCDGDADNLTQVTGKNYRVYTDDLALLSANWKKKITDVTLNPCADFDHKAQVTGKNYRVYTDDLAILSANWKKKDTALPGNCPRSE